MRIPIVNEQDEIIGYKDWLGRDDKDIIRVTGLWVTDPEGNILLAQRALNKKHDPGKWGPAVSGTVEEGETYESNIIKEAEEEIGLSGYEFKMSHKNRRSTSHEYWGQWFTVVVPHDYLFKKQDEEVEEIKWFSRNDIMKLLKEKPEMFLREFERYMNMF
jgi:isopentenyl-diphosphate delta-isomerase